jgi:hypothetical protein
VAENQVNPKDICAILLPRSGRKPWTNITSNRLRIDIMAIEVDGEL